MFRDQEEHDGNRLRFNKKEVLVKANLGCLTLNH